MSQTDEPMLQLHRSFSFEDVQWISVLEVLTTRFKLPFEEAQKLVKDFLVRFRKPLFLGWFLHKRLSADDNRLLASVCQSHGTDKITLIYQREVQYWPFTLDYRQEVTFCPSFRHSEQGQVAPHIVLQVCGLTLVVNSLLRAIATQLAVVTLGIALYVLVGALLLYSLSVFLLFIHQPVDFTLAATRQAKVGLALLGILVVLAALTGKAIRNIVRDLSAWLRSKRGKARGNSAENKTL